MPALADLQRAVRDTVLGADPSRLQGQVADDRLGVYRNNTTILLSEALATNFPVVYALVGEAFFAPMARAFLRLHPPRSPCLFEYGAALADFIAGYPPAASLPYLADVARLEWACDEALHAADAQVLDATALARVPPEAYARLTFAAHPAMRVVASPYPVHAIWALHQPGGSPDARVDLGQGGEAVLVTRPGREVRLTPLAPGGAVFTQLVLMGAPLERAFVCAQRDAPAFDGGRALATLLAHGAFCAFCVTTPK